MAFTSKYFSEQTQLSHPSSLGRQKKTTPQNQLGVVALVRAEKRRNFNLTALSIEPTVIYRIHLNAFAQ